MAVKIRLARTGRKKMAYYRVVVADSQMPGTGAASRTSGRTPPGRTRRSRDRRGGDSFVARQGRPATETVKSLLKKQGTWKKFQAGKTAAA